MAHLIRRTLKGHSDDVNAVAFAPGDGSLLASGSDDNSVKVWDVASGRLRRTLKGHSGRVRSVAFAPGTGAMLASGSEDKTIKLWNVSSGQLMHTLQVNSMVCSVAFSPRNGAILASGSLDKTIKLWNVASNQLLRTLEGHSSSVLSVTFSPAGTVLASGSGDTTIKLWDVASGQLRHTLQGHSDTIFSVAFAPGDGAVLASAGAKDKTIKLWDVASGKLLRTLEVNSDVYSVAFSPHKGDAVLASGSSDGSIKLWDVASGQLLRSHEVHANIVMSVAFSPGDGAVLATGSLDKCASLVSEVYLPRFFRALNDFEREDLDSYAVLDKLGPLVEDVTQLKLYYTAANTALRNGKITESQRTHFITKAIEAAPANFRFDQEKHVAAALKHVIAWAKDDGILSNHDALRFGQMTEEASAFADVRFVSVVRTLANVAHRVDQVERRVDHLGRRVDHLGRRVDTHERLIVDLDERVRATDKRVDEVIAFAQEVDDSLRDLKLGISKYLKRKATVGSVRAVIGLFTMGMGTGLVDALSVGYELVCENVVDFGNPTHVISAIKNASSGDYKDLMESFADDKVDAWIEKPLEDAVKQKRVRREHLKIAALVKTSHALDGGSASRDTSQVPNSMSHPSTGSSHGTGATLQTVPRAHDDVELADAAASFAKLRSLLELDDATKEVPIDRRFWTAFQVLFKINLRMLGDGSREKCLRLLDDDENGTTNKLEWKLFVDTWVRSQKTIADFIQA